MSAKPSNTLEVALSAKGFANIPRKAYVNDFTFTVGDARYECPALFAAFLSPRIGSLQSIDPTIHEFDITTNDPHSYFPQILGFVQVLHF
jgi:hypothetical protein